MVLVMFLSSFDSSAAEDSKNKEEVVTVDLYPQSRLPAPRDVAVSERSAPHEDPVGAFLEE